MPKSTHASIILVRFDDICVSGPVSTDDAGTLFLEVGADIRAAATDYTSKSAFKFAIYGLHDSAESARRAVDNRLEIAPWIADAKEVWCAVLAPFRHFGESNFLDQMNPGAVFEQTEGEPPAGTPIVVVTSAGWNLDALDMDRLKDFGAGVAAVRISMTAVPGLHSQQTFTMDGSLEHDGITVTIWQDFASMVAFAYGPGLHRKQVKRQRDETFGDRTSFTRFTVMHSEGTWHGTNPFLNQ